MDNKTNRKSDKEDNKTSFISSKVWGNIFTGLMIVAIGGLITAIINYGNRITAVEERVNALNERLKETGTGVNGPDKEKIDALVTSIKNAENELIEIIKNIQSRHVKKSTGTYDYNSFTDIDLEKFHKNDVPGKIEKDLLSNGEFLSIVLAIKRMPPEDWGKIKDVALKTYKPTFAEAGGVKTDGSAQTEAGQAAEIEIVQRIIKVVSDVKSKSEAEIFGMIG